MRLQIRATVVVNQDFYYLLIKINVCKFIVWLQARLQNFVSCTSNFRNGHARARARVNGLRTFVMQE